MKLMRFKDNTFAWLFGANDSSISSILTEKEAVAFGIWNLKILRTEIILGINNLKFYASVENKKDNVAIYSDNNKIYLYTTKQGDALG